MNDHSIIQLNKSKLLERDKIASSVIVYKHLHYYYSNITAETVSVSIPTPSRKSRKHFVGTSFP